MLYGGDKDRLTVSVAGLTSRAFNPTKLVLRKRKLKWDISGGEVGGGGGGGEEGKIIKGEGLDCQPVHYKLGASTQLTTHDVCSCHFTSPVCDKMCQEQTFLCISWKWTERNPDFD